MLRHVASKRKHVFAGIYYSELYLWQMKAKSYHGRDKKEIGRKWKEVDPSCTKSTILKKIINLRSSLRKQTKEEKDSGADEINVFKLWHYDLLKFVEDQEVPRNHRSKTLTTKTVKVR